MPDDRSREPHVETEASSISIQTPWWERYPSYFLREVQLARAKGYNVQLRPWYANGDPQVMGERLPYPFVSAPQADVRLVAHGRVRICAARPGEDETWHGFDVDFAYPPDFPFDKIEIRPVDPALRRRRHQLSNSGNLCFMQEELEGWAVGYGIERAIEGAEDWFVGEVTGTFKDEVPAAELLSYLELNSGYMRAVVLPEHAIWEQVPLTAKHGVFMLEWERPRRGVSPGLAVFGAAGVVGERINDSLVRTTNERVWRSLRSGRYEERQKRTRPRQHQAVPMPRRGNIPNHGMTDPDAPVSVQGLWFALNSEPRPFQDLTGLKEALAEHGSISDGDFRNIVKPYISRLDARERGWLPVALNYPPAMRRADHAGPSREWLIVLLEWPGLAAHERKGKRAKNEGFWPHIVVRGVPSYSVRPVDLQRRVGATYTNAGAGDSDRLDVTEMRPLEAMRVVVVGVGALGSTVARSLAAIGVRHFVLIDPDRVTPGNVVRHEARLPEIGLAKIDAMEKILRETNPYVEIEVLDGTRNQSGKLEENLLDPQRRPDLIIATVALKAVDGQLDDLARCADPPISVLHAWVMAEAQVLRTFVYRPGRTACLYCNGLYPKNVQGPVTSDPPDSGFGHGYISEPTTPSRPFYETSCASPAFPGAGNANALAAHVVVEMALDTLQNRLPDEESHWVFAGNRIRDIDPTFVVAPLTVVRNGFPPHPECPICNGVVFGDNLTMANREEYERELAHARGQATVKTVDP